MRLLLHKAAPFVATRTFTLISLFVRSLYSSSSLTLLNMYGNMERGVEKPERASVWCLNELDLEEETAFLMHSTPLKKHILFGCGEAGRRADEKSCKLEESTYVFVDAREAGSWW